jgi:hypothetical protein
MDDKIDDEIVQDSAITAVPCVVVKREDFKRQKEFYTKVKAWCRQRHPKVFVVEEEIEDELRNTFGWAPESPKVSFFFTSAELYLEFVKEFPQVLRGEDSEF